MTPVTATEKPLCPPEQVEIPPAIKKAAAMGKLAFFVGNGISRLYGMPSWDELCARMLRALADKNVIDHNKVELLSRQTLKARISIADHYFQELRKSGANADLTYGDMLKQTRESSAYASLARCGVKFVTTNYDSLLSDALEGLDKATDVVKNIDITQQDGETPTSDKPPAREVRVFTDPYKFAREQLLHNNAVFHIHGTTSDENTIIASTLSYLKLYSSQHIREFLRWFFENHVVVFLGYGLDELELLDLIVRSGARDGASQTDSSLFLLLPLLSHEAEILELLKIYYSQLGIEVLAFSRDQKDYAAYADLLEHWSGDLAKQAKEPTRVDALKLIDKLMTEFEGGSE